MERVLPGFLSRFRSRVSAAVQAFAKGDADLITPGYILHDIATVTPSGSYELAPTPEGLLKLYVENAWVYAYVTANARALGAAPWSLKRWNPETGQGDVVTDHPLIDLLEEPSPGNTWETLIQSINPHLDLAGNAYLENVAAERAGESDDGRDVESGQVVELRPLLPTKMRVFVHPTNGIEKYVYRPNMTDNELDPKDVTYLRLVDPRSETKGVGPALPGWLTARVDNEALRWNAGFFRRGATPGVVLETPEKIPQAERTRIVAEFDEKFGGTDKAHKTACLPYGLKATPFGQTMREMQFRELRKMTREELGSIFGTPPILVGVMDGAAYANAYLQLQIFRDYHVLPRLRYIFAMLTASLAHRFPDSEGLYIEPDTSEMRLPDEEDRELTRAVQLTQAGIIDADEARAMIGLAPRDKAAGAPSPEAPVVIATPTEKRAALARMNGRAASTARHASRGDGRTWFSRLSKIAPHLVAVEKRRRPLIAVNWERQPAGSPARRAEFQKDDGSADGAKSDEDGGAVGASTSTSIDDLPLTPWRMAKRRDRAVSRHEEKATKAMRAWLDKVKAKALALVRRKLGKADDVYRANEVSKARGDDAAPRVDVTEEELRAILAEPLTRALQDALRGGLEDGGRDASDAIGVAFGLPNEDVSRYLAERETNLESVLNEDTAAMVKDALRAGYEQGMNETELIGHIAESGAFADSRAQRIARTELHAAHGAGAIAQARAAGVDKKRWIASPDEATRPAHREASGQVVDIDEPFVVDDEELDFPGDPDGSAGNVINCRCVNTYERSEEPSADDVDALTERIDGEDDAAVEQVQEAVRGLPDDVLTRVDARAMGGLTVDRGKGSAVEYDGESRTLTVGPRARKPAIQDGVKEHLVNTVTTAVDARGFHNARRLSGLPDVGGKEDGPGTERERAVALVSRAATGDRAGLESVIGRALTNGEWTQYKVLGQNFWAGFGAKAGKPEVRNRG